MASVSKRKWKAPGGEERSAYVVRYRDKGGTHRSRQFDKKKDADRFRTEVEVEISQGDHVARSQSMTVATFVRDYVDHQDRRCQERIIGITSLRLIRNALETHVEPALSNKLLVDLRVGDMDGWLRGLVNKKDGKPLALVSKRRIAGCFAIALDYAVKRGFVRRNVLRDVMSEHLGGVRDAVRTFSKDDVRALLAVLETRGDKRSRRSYQMLRSMVLLALYCGLRHGEILALTWASIDLDKRLIRVRANLTCMDEVKGPKTRAGIRDVPIPELVARQLEAWRPFAVEDARGLIFRRANGTHMQPSGFYNSLWHPILNRAGLGPDAQGRALRFHSLRHFYASVLVEQAVPLTEVASLMGHSKYDMTLQVYAHTIAGGHGRHAVIDRISDDLGGDAKPDFVPARLARTLEKRAQEIRIAS